jgi:hypothetical protein
VRFRRDDAMFFAAFLNRHPQAVAPRQHEDEYPSTWEVDPLFRDGGHDIKIPRGVFIVIQF